MSLSPSVSPSVSGPVLLVNGVFVNLHNVQLMLSVRRLLALGVAFLASRAATTFALEGAWRESDKVIAYAVSVTRDGPYMDGAAVLAHAIRTAARRSKYGFELVAIVHPTVQTSREPLQKAGWKCVHIARSIGNPAQLL